MSGEKEQVMSFVVGPAPSHNVPPVPRQRAFGLSVPWDGCLCLTTLGGYGQGLQDSALLAKEPEVHPPLGPPGAFSPWCPSHWTPVETFLGGQVPDPSEKVMLPQGQTTTAEKLWTFCSMVSPCW